MTIFNHKTGKRAAKTRKARRHRHVDVERTKEARDAGYFLDKRSFFDIHGGEFRYGQDMMVVHDAVIARDGWQCVFCKDGSQARINLTVHHVIPRGNGGDDSIKNLSTICRDCHEKLHRVPGARQRRADLASHGTLLLLAAASCAMLFLGACSRPVEKPHEELTLRVLPPAAPTIVIYVEHDRCLGAAICIGDGVPVTVQDISIEKEKDGSFKIGGLPINNPEALGK